MSRSDLQTAEMADTQRHVLARPFLAARSSTYTLIVLAGMIAAFGYSLRHDGIFTCQASGYGANRYLAYCQATAYSDYDHGAFWFGYVH
jgi:hypothetical protein